MAPRAAGQISEILVARGDLVKKGQAIAHLENADAVALRDQWAANLDLANASLEHARLAYAEAAANHDKNVVLYRSAELPEADYSNSESALRKAKSVLSVAEATVKAHAVSLRSAEISLGHTSVKAPFDGIVLSVNSHVGDMVSPLLTGGDQEGGIMTLADLSAIEAEVGVPEFQMETIKAGDPCIVIVDSLKRHFRAEVDSIMPPAGEDSETALVRVVFLEYDHRLLPDMTANVSFLTQEILNEGDKPLFMISRKALVPNFGGYSVFIARGEHAVKKKVRIGKQLKDRVEILEGVTSNDLVILSPPDGLRNGSKVVSRKGDIREIGDGSEFPPDSLTRRNSDPSPIFTRSKVKTGPVHG